MSKPTPEEVDRFFKIKHGIFENTDHRSGIEKLDADFKKEHRTRFGDISFDHSLISIKELRDRIKNLEKEHPVPMSHLSVFYGLDDDGPSTSMKLIFRGMHLSPKKEIIVIDEARTNSRMSLIAADKNRAKRQLQNFKKKFDVIHGKGKYINGCYLKINSNAGGKIGIGIINLLDIFESVECGECDEIDIRFGFMNPDGFTSDVVDVGLTCFHMIFTGRKSSNASFVAPRVFSTFDNESGYVGPKPACPPFCPK